MKNTLLKRHFLTQVHEIRASTRRSNLRYTIMHLRQGQYDIVQEAASMMQKLWQQRFGGRHGENRAIVFTRSKAEADRLAGLLGCASYHSEAGEVQDKARIITSWASGSASPFLVGTSGLGAGLDYPYVRVVTHVDEPYGAVEFSQEAGRGGRDGREAQSIIVLRHGWKAGVRRESERNEKVLQQFLSSSTCRRAALDEYMDGVEEPAVCDAQDAVCDNCRRVPRPEATGSRAREPAQAATGPTVLLRQAREEEQEMDVYRDNLEAVKGQCMICRTRGLEEWQHAFSQCRQAHKWRYIEAKRAVLHRSRRRWVGRFDACFYCFQPQTVCDRVASGRCRYEDLVMQAVFARFEVQGGGEWWMQRFGVGFEKVEDCLLWAGGSGRLGGTRCVQGVVVLSQVLQEWGRQIR